MSTTLKAVLFDLDDTLIDWSGFAGDWFALERGHMRPVYDYVTQSVHPVAVHFEAFLTEFRERFEDGWASARSTMRAPHLERTIAETLVAVGVPAEKIDIRAIVEGYYAWGSVEGVVVFPEVPRVLEMLIDRGIKIGIVTNASQPGYLRDVELEQFGLMQYFPDCRVTAADAGYLKPHAMIFQKALDLLNVQATDTVFIGDNPVADVAGSQSAGMRGILRVREDTYDLPKGLVTPDAIISSLDQLVRIFDEWYVDW